VGFLFSLLLLWTVCGLGWWWWAGQLAGRGREFPQTGEAPGLAERSGRISIFKPVPPLQGTRPDPRTVAAIESFVRELDGTSELLLGIGRDDAAAWAETVARWRKGRADEALKVVVLDRPRQRRNPKIAWMERLAPEARGEYWLWSDADITLRPGGLQRLRQEWAAAGTPVLTAPYVIRAFQRPCEILDACFVNAEFFPGTQLLKQKPVQFGFGALLLFSAQDFAQKIRWEEIGNCLAEDHWLGRQLAPVRISNEVMETHASVLGWKEGWRHYYRWSKTVRWCKPGAFAAQILILPLVGWGLAIFWYPEALWGLIIVWLAESYFGFKLCGMKRPEVFWCWLVWPGARLAVWAACWAPVGVEWPKGCVWRGWRESC
jgi:ceramide glucosyltransferase